MWPTVIERRSCPYAPYIQLLLNKKWYQKTQRHLDQEMNITYHLEKSFKVKVHKQPRSAEERDAVEAGTGIPTVPTRAAASSVPYDVRRSDYDKEPSWLGKLMTKLKKSFCLKQEKIGRAHV